MAAATVTVGNFFASYGRRLELDWVAGRGGSSRSLQLAGDESSLSLVGRLNFIHPHRLQVLGRSELDYLAALGPSLDPTLTSLFSGNSVAIFIVDGRGPLPELLHHAEAGNTPLFTSPLSIDKFVDHLSYFLTTLLADKTVLHGVLMDVMGIGVLLTGASAVGKSELALELISRGHRLIADDAPEFSRTSPDTLYGTCPEALRDFLEVRGLGILNIRALFGDSAIKQGKNLRLVVNLTPVDPAAPPPDRLHGSRHVRQIQDVDVAEIQLPVAPGRNLAVLVEAAARQQILFHNGYDGANDFIERQRRLLASDDHD